MVDDAMVTNLTSAFMRKRCELEGGAELWPMLLEAHGTLVDLIERDLLKAGGPPLTWYDVLAQLELAPEHRLRMNELADSVLLSRSGVTRLVDRMVEEGLVERAACDTDRRVVHARITPQGRKVFAKAKPIVEASVNEYFITQLSDPELKSLRSALNKVLSGRTASARAS